MDAPPEVVSAGRYAVERYMAAKKAGESENMAVIIAMRTPPGTRYTERAFMEGRAHNPFGSQSDLLNRVAIADANEAGISTAGKVFMGGLADGRMFRDPMAWVSGYDDVKRVCAMRGRSCEGAVNYRAPDMPPTPDVPLAEDLIQEMALKECVENPDEVRKMKKGDLREKVIHKYGAPARGKNLVPLPKKKRVVKERSS